MICRSAYAILALALALEGLARPSAVAAPLTVRIDASDAYVARDACLTTAVARDVAWECDDLRVTHALPSVTVRGRPYTPTLVYRSRDAHPVVVVGMTVGMRVGVPAGLTGDSVRVTLLFGDSVVARRAWSLAAWLPAAQRVAGDDSEGGTSRRVAVAVDAAARETGLYPYTVVAVAGVDTARTSGRLLVVNHRASPLGAGWSVSGQERLVPLQRLALGLADSLLWIGGDGSAHVYRRRGVWSAVFTADANTRPDSLVHTEDGFVRALPGRGQVVFDERGRHRLTRDALGNVVAFDVDTVSNDNARVDRVVRLRIRGPRAELTYAFDYVGDSLGSPIRVRVDAPRADGEPRAVDIDLAEGRAHTIRDPDGSTVQFAYDATTAVMRERTDRRGTTWRFAYDTIAQTLTHAGSATRAAGDDEIAHAFVSASVAGLVAPHVRRRCALRTTARAPT